MSNYNKRDFRWTSCLGIIIFIGLVIWLGYIAINGLGKGVISPLGNGNQDGFHFILFKDKPKDVNQLISQIKNIINKQTGMYSVYIFDINKELGLGINENTIFTAASVNKILILAALYFDAQAGKIDLDTRITIQSRDIQDFGTGIIRNQGPGGMYSLKTLAQLMMTKSDNTAAYILTNIVGQSRIQELVNSWGLTQTDIANNKTSNKDISGLFVKMYREQIANKALTREMLGFLIDSDFENRLPALLPKDTKIYHKIGSEVGNIHDVGIVYFEKNPYYIGVMTNDITDEEAAEKTIAQISKLTYDFMNQ